MPALPASVLRTDLRLVETLHQRDAIPQRPRPRDSVAAGAPPAELARTNLARVSEGVTGEPAAAPAQERRGQG